MYVAFEPTYCILYTATFKVWSYLLPLLTYTVFHLNLHLYDKDKQNILEVLWQK
jgi:hypothetical protein